MSSPTCAICDLRGSFSAAFKGWRHKHHVPLKRIAQDLDLAVSTVSSWELGGRFPSEENLKKLIAYTGLPPCRLFCVMADECVPAKCLLVMRRGVLPAVSGQKN